MSTSITTTQLQQQYIAYFGRPGDPAGIKYWLESGITEANFAATIHAQDEYKTSTVGSKSTEDQIDGLYQNLFGRSADAGGLIYWTVEVEAGRKSLGDLAVHLIYSTENPTAGNEDQAAADKAVLDAKVKSAEAFTADIEADTALIKAYQPESEGDTFVVGKALTSAKTWLAGITSTEATAAEVDAATNNVLTANDAVVVAVPTYSVATDVSSVDEGGTVTTTVTTTDVAEGTTLYWEVSGTGITATDFAASSALTGSGTVASDGTLSFSHDIATDSSTEGTERLSIKVFTDANRTAQAGTTLEVSIADVAVVTADNKSLTTAVDSFTGTSKADTYIASEATLTAGDNIDGGSETDTLRYTASGAAAVTETGFTTTSVETLKLQSDATGGTTFTASGATDVSKIVNTLSTTDLTVEGVKALTTVDLDTVGGGDTQVKFSAGLVTGSSDAVTLNLSSNVTAANAAIGTVTLGNTTGTGFETVNVVTSGGASKLTAIATGATTINVSGDQDLTISNALASATTIDATSFTGKLNVVADSAGAAKDVAITGGTADDTADFTAGFEADDSFTGGEGTDTLELTQAVASGAIAGTLSGVEQLGISDAGTGTIDMDSFSGITKVIYDAGVTANGLATVDDAVSGVAVHVDAANLVAADGSLTVSLKTDGSADVVTVEIDSVAAGEGMATLTAAEAETLNISVDDDTTDATGTYTFAAISAADATSVVLSGDSEITISGFTDPTTPVLASIDASAATDKVVISGVNFVKTGATITLGAADDTFTLDTADGADTIDLSKGGSDKVVYTALAQSDDATDTIKGFTSGDDDIDLTGLVGKNVISSSQFAGVASSFAEAQSLLNGTKVAVFDSASSTLWVDIDADSILESNVDFRVKLDGVTSIVATDLALDTGVTATSNQAAFVTTTKTHFTEGKALTNEDDTLNTTVAHVAGSTIDGKSGTDTISITGSGALSLLDANVTGGFTNFETLTVGSAVTTLTLAAADTGTGQLTTITGASGYTQTLALATDDLTDVDLDNFTTLTGSGTGATALTLDTDNFDDVTTITLQAGASFDSLILNDGTYDFSSVTVTFADTDSNLLDLNTDGNAARTVTVDAADIANVVTITGETTASVITTLNFNDTDDIGTSGIVTNIDTITIGTSSNTNQTLSVAGNDFGTAQFTTVTGSGDDNLTLIGNNAATFASATVTGIDTINIAALTGSAATFDASAASYGTITLTGDTGTDLAFTETADYSNLQTTALQFNAVVVTDATTVTLDAHSFSGDTVALDGTAGGTDAVVNLKMRTTGTLDLSGTIEGANNDIGTVAVTGTSGNDTITGLGTANAVLKHTIDAGAGDDVLIVGADFEGTHTNDNTVGHLKFTGGAGNDTFRLFDMTNTDLGTSAVFAGHGVEILDFDADNEQILIPDALTDNSNSVTEKASATALDVTTRGIMIVTGAAASDLMNETQVIAALGTITSDGDASDECVFVVKNASSTKFGVYKYDDGATAIASGQLNLLATVTYTGTLDTSSLGIF